ncbi:hypothetical protein [Methylophilus sp. Leaf408]|uniref:hypothetical protein n=1 Tax=Methylophilus sp. Leaf408 TaxID=2876561 RepID=UPI001E3CA4EF|nr:hypothetical protein [Methylophilus sp. Leaf408]
MQTEYEEEKPKNIDYQAQNEEIKKKLVEFEDHIDMYRASLNSEGIWLFLATLGCWSVNHAPSQILAFSITFILFTYRIALKFSDTRLFSTKTKELEELIKRKLEDPDTQKARLFDLHQIKVIKLASKNHLKSVSIFLLCYFFLITTVWHFI